MKPWIAFDAAGTLFEPAEPVVQIYAECFSKFGFSVDERIWRKAFVDVFRLMPDPVYPQAGNGEEVEKNWWRELVRKAAELTGIQPSAEVMDEAFEELFAHYAAGSAWKAFPETEAVLQNLKERGVRLGVVSNFDSRLHRVMAELGLDRYFEFILTSADVSARKPSPRLIERFMERAGVRKNNCCLAGDSLALDGGAAQAAGIEFFHLKRPELSLHDFMNWHQTIFGR